MSSDQVKSWPEWQTLERYALAAAGAGLVLSGLGWVLNPQAFFIAYLTAFLFWLGISLGCLALWLLHNLTGGNWGFALRRILEALRRARVRPDGVVLGALGGTRGTRLARMVEVRAD